MRRAVVVVGSSLSVLRLFLPYFSSVLLVICGRGLGLGRALGLGRGLGVGLATSSTLLVGGTSILYFLRAFLAQTLPRPRSL